MRHASKRSRRQYSLRSLLIGTTWAALVVAVCVGQQQAATRQREVIEHFKSQGILPVTTIGGRPFHSFRAGPSPAVEERETKPGGA